MNIVEIKYLTGSADVDMHKWLSKEISKHVATVIGEMKESVNREPSPEELRDMKESATALVLRKMPARLQLMKLYLEQCCIVGRLKEAVEADPDNQLEQLRHDAAESCRWAISRYLMETEVSDEMPPCNCESCQERRAREAEEEDAATDTVIREMVEDGLSVARLVSMDGKGNSLDAPMTHAFRCKSCKAIQYNEEPCTCGGVEFGPLVIVDLPVEQMEAMDEMAAAEDEFGITRAIH